jgi:Secretion system C-terminal sorting domain
MKKLFFLSAIIFISSVAFSQNKILLSDNFNDNKNGWHLQSDSLFLVDINNGVLHIEKFKKNRDAIECLWYRKEISGLNTLEDFSITMFAKFLPGGDILDMFDMQWGAWDEVITGNATSIYQLNFLLKGEVKLDYFNNKKWTYSLREKVKEILDRNLYRPGQYNKYEIVQKGGFVVFKINDIEYFKQLANAIAGNTIGFQGCLKSALEIDKIIVMQLSKTEKQQQPVAAIDSVKHSEKNNADDLKVYSRDRILLSDNFNNNKNGWRLQSDSLFLVDINSGVLHIEKFKKNFDARGCLWYKKEITGLNTLENFSITIFAKFLSGGDILDMLDIQWGTWDKVISSKVTSIYQLNFLLKGEVKLDYFNKQWNYTLRTKAKEILDRNLYRPGEFNKYEIVQKDGFIIFSVNDVQYFKQFASAISGNTIGFQGCLKSAWEIDKIIVKQMKRKTEKQVEPASTVAVTDSLKQTEKNNADAFKVYPNPFVNEFTLTVFAAKITNAKIELFDMQANLITQYDKKLDAGENAIRMYADVPSGAYILKLTIDNKVTSTKLVKM